MTFPRLPQDVGGGGEGKMANKRVPCTVESKM